MNNLCCWLVTCRPGNSVLVTVVEKPIWPAHAAARRRKANAYVTGRTEPPVGLVHPIIGPLRPAIRSCRQPAIRAVAEQATLAKLVHLAGSGDSVGPFQRIESDLPQLSKK
jgi:hypothetical protein